MHLNCAVGEDSWDPLDCKEIKPVHPKGNQSWIFTGRTDALIIWLPDVKNWLTGKDPDAGKDWRQKEKGTAEDEMVGWHHQHNGHEFEQAPGDSKRQGTLACCNPWGSQGVGRNLETEHHHQISSHRFTAGEECCLSMNHTSNPIHVWCRQYLD